MKTITLTALALSGIAVMVLAASGPTTDLSSDEAYKRLVRGNARYVAGNMEHPRLGADRRADTVGGQQPFATILACSDSRVPVEAIFDQGVGDLFVVRVAGQVPDDSVVGTVEYAVGELKTPLVVVMGHSGCGAVKAAMAGVDAPGKLGELIEEIEPAIELTKREFPEATGNELETRCIQANVAHVITTLFAQSPTLARAAKQREVKVLGALYDLESGRVRWLQGPGAARGRADSESATILSMGVPCRQDHSAEVGTGSTQSVRDDPEQPLAPTRE